MDVGLVTSSNDRSAHFTWTAKLPEYLACNVFPVVTDVCRSRRFVARCGALLPFDGFKDPSYPKRLARLIRDLLENPQLLERRLRGRELARTHVSFEVAARHLERGIRRAMQAQ
jgi:glycosyltransferase involved in cell wall biosynthesis